MPRRTSEELLQLFKENWPQGYSTSEEVMLRLYHSALRHTEEMQRLLARFDLSFAEFVTMRVLRREPEPHVTTPTVLHETLVMSPAAVTKVLKRLEAKGFISRMPDSRDRRHNLVQLTELGVAETTRVQESVSRFDLMLLDRTLSAREQTQLARLLRKLLISLEPTRSAAARAEATRTFDAPTQSP